MSGLAEMNKLSVWSEIYVSVLTFSKCWYKQAKLVSCLSKSHVLLNHWECLKQNIYDIADRIEETKFRFMFIVLKVHQHDISAVEKLGELKTKQKKG